MHVQIKDMRMQNVSSRMLISNSRTFGGRSVTENTAVQVRKMWIQVRSMDGSKNVRMDGLSKLTKLEELRERLTEHFDAEPERQRLFYRGKQVRVPSVRD